MITIDVDFETKEFISEIIELYKNHNIEFHEEHFPVAISFNHKRITFMNRPNYQLVFGDSKIGEIIRLCFYTPTGQLSRIVCHPTEELKVSLILKFSNEMSIKE